MHRQTDRHTYQLMRIVQGLVEQDWQNMSRHTYTQRHRLVTITGGWTEGLAVLFDMAGHNSNLLPESGNTMCGVKVKNRFPNDEVREREVRNRRRGFPGTVYQYV